MSVGSNDHVPSQKFRRAEGEGGCYLEPNLLTSVSFRFPNVGCDGIGPVAEGRGRVAPSLGSHEPRQV